MKIILIGPFPPLRGGISMFNHSLAKELEKDNQVYRISFSKQYPNLFFPGKTQFFDFNGKSSMNLINSVNPLSWKSTANYINNIEPDLVIFQYWMPFFAPAFSSIAKKIKNTNDTKIIVNCNNIIPHESGIFDKYLSLKFFKHCDYFIVMSDSVKNDLLSIIPSASYIESKHPLYDTFGNSIDKEEARKSLSLKSEKVILNFGLIRDYKGLDLLIESTDNLKNKLDDFKIVVAGECYNGEQQYYELARKLGVEDCFDFKFKFVENSDIPKYFCAADVVVLPYKSATQSGIIPIAYHYNKPVITTNVGGLAECVLHGKTGFICDTNPQSISNGILEFFNSNENFINNVNEYKKQFSWEIFVKNMIAAIR